VGAAKVEEVAVDAREGTSSGRSPVMPLAVNSRVEGYLRDAPSVRAT